MATLYHQFWSGPVRQCGLADCIKLPNIVELISHSDCESPRGDVVRRRHATRPARMEAGTTASGPGRRCARRLLPTRQASRDGAVPPHAAEVLPNRSSGTRTRLPADDD